ncbi:MAG: DUF1638 domain-containing protein [Armatimonadetes bacterium]|nr:DUF1638 domain-containing protein [Armatimonadota bacterium]
MRLKLISCEVLYREMCLAAVRSPNVVDIEFLPRGLHDLGAARMQALVQAALDRVDATQYDAALFGYGLCNNGLVGLRAPAVPLVVPRAHDCITLFLGSKERYLEYFNAHPGVYFKTTGWIERDRNPEDLSQLSIQRLTGMDISYEQLVARYGEENARYLYEMLGDRTRNYSQFTFIEMGVEPDDSFEQRTREEAARRGWKFEKVQGDLSLIQHLLDGDWNEDEFLMVPPGYRVAASYCGDIIAAEKVS